MNYDEELEFLRKEFKKSEAKFHEAEREGWHTDSNIYEDNMANLGYQIHIHEQAAKADEYEAKAKAYNDTLKTLDKLINNDERFKEARSNDFVAGMSIGYENIFNLMEDYIKESGEPNA